MDYERKYHKYKTKYLFLRKNKYGGKSNDKLAQIYDGIVSILSKSNIEFILIYGTLLGYIRENNFINGDDDIDIMINRKDENALIEFMTENKMKFRKNTDDVIQLFVNDLGPCDVYLYDIIGNDLSVGWYKKQILPKNLILPPKKIIFKNCPIHIPMNPEKILELLYGNNWRIPANKNSYTICETCNSNN